MKIYLRLVTIGVFLFGAFSGANLHTLLDIEAQNLTPEIKRDIVAVRLLNMSLRQLSEEEI